MPPLSHQYDECIELTLSPTAGSKIYDGIVAEHYMRLHRSDSTEEQQHLQKDVKFPRRSRKTVRWSDAPAAVAVIPHRGDYTFEQRQQIWNSTRELHALRQEHLQIVQLLNVSTFLVPAGTCTRGLDTLTQSARTRRRQCKEAAKKAVFDEQESQKCSGLRDVRRIAELYSKSTSKCSQTALFVALADHNEARAIHGRRLQ